ncbi:MAG: transposase [Bdellovibrionota bacterium]
MARKALIRSNFYPYHIVNRTLDQKFYDLDNKLLWSIYTDCLCILTWVYGVRIHAFVLMSNHYHLLLSTPDENLDDAIRYLQTEVSKQVASYKGSSSYRFESRYKWSIIYNRSHYINVLKYVYQNPLRGGISTRIAGYRWSTAHGALGYSRLLVPLYLHDFQLHSFYDPMQLEDHEKWLNALISEDDVVSIRAGLRRFEFKNSNRYVSARKKVAGVCKKVAGTRKK